MRTIGQPAPEPIRNRLLAALAPKDYRRISQHLVKVPMEFGQVLHEAGGPMKHVYFPNSGTISLLAVVSPLKGTQVGMFGSDGIVGLSAALGARVSPLRAIVQGNGSAMRLPTAHARSEVASNDAWSRELLRFSADLLAQATQTSACNRFHTVESRLASWLLAMRERLNSNDFMRTHQFLALMLGVRRVGVTVAASSFEEQGLISYSRGNIRITDSKGLEELSCGCYGNGHTAKGNGKGKTNGA